MNLALADVEARAVGRDLGELLFYTVQGAIESGVLEQRAWSLGAVRFFNALVEDRKMRYEEADELRHRLYVECREAYYRSCGCGREHERFSFIPPEIAHQTYERVFGLPPGTYALTLSVIVDEAIRSARSLHLQRKN